MIGHGKLPHDLIMKQAFDFSHWQPLAHWNRITAIDMHTGGEPLRVYTSGLPPIEATRSGVSARAALHHAKGELGLNEKITIESIIGSTMTVQAVEATKFGPHDAVVPEVSGTAAIIGRNEFYFDPDDSLGRGFLLR